MMNLQELSSLRFEMSEVPTIGGQPGIYEEKWSQWFLERSFFRDFTYRNPRGKKKGDELADALVLFDDVALMVQVKAQCGQYDSTAWAAGALQKATKQLCDTYEKMFGNHIKKMKNDFYGEINFNPSSYTNRYGLIILAHDSTPYIAIEQAPELLNIEFPVHVFSLNDFAVIASRFDTAGDLIGFLELRTDMGTKQAMWVHDEGGNIERIIPHIGSVYSEHTSFSTPESLAKSVRAFVETATGNLLRSPDWKFGLAIDDMIAHAHDIDPELPWNVGRQHGGLEVARFLGWLTRARRIALGKKFVGCCDAALDGELHYFSHAQPSAGTASVYLATQQSRSERVKTLSFLVSYAHMKYNAKQCFGVASEPIGNGRSYDFITTKGPLPDAIRKSLESLPDPFSSGGSLWTD
jgi:hypothetical protein